MTTIYTIGHSNLALERFLDLLEEHGIECVVDVRSYPRSRYVPHFDRHALQAALERRGVGYTFMGKLLGGRSPHPEHYPDGKLDYALLVASPAFGAGLEQAASKAQERTVALMCSEEDPLRCHRGLVIGRHFHENGWEVRHIRAKGEIETHEDLEDRMQGKDGGLQLGLWQAAPDLNESYRAQGLRIAPEYRRDLRVRSDEERNL